ncbi:hypothetical protein SAMN05880557_11819 [Pseudacidovorax sp. RU35E]|jgi:hypothetical protein|nr:hypothetical protein SAMN05880557_11819 [Pseudacidovorax sp. RU35E]
MAPEQLLIIGLGTVLGLILFFVSVEATPTRMLVIFLLSVAISLALYHFM